METSFDPNLKPSLGRLGQEIKFHQKLIKHGVVPTCINCEHWGMNQGAVTGKPPKEEVCRLYSMRPPAEVIVFGCPSWEWDLPF